MTPSYTPQICVKKSLLWPVRPGGPARIAVPWRSRRNGVLQGRSSGQPEIRHEASMRLETIEETAEG